jgi:hypothetical protein
MRRPRRAGEHKVNDWLLGILRFSVTLDAKDEAAVMARAVEIDRLGFVTQRPGFSFFARTSAELCNAIADIEYPGRREILSRHLRRIDNRRLRQAFSAALGFEERAPRKLIRHGA